MSKLKVGIYNSIYAKRHTKKTRALMSKYFKNKVSYSISVSIENILSKEKHVFKAILQ